jgi:heme o synthase
MAQEQTQNITWGAAIRQGLADFSLLVKFRLSMLVLFSAVMSYAIVAGGDLSWSVLLLVVGGFLVTGAANTLNQVLERDYDLQMNRTANRPIAAGRMSVSSAVLLAGFMTLIGGAMLSFFNPLTGVLGMLSLISYAFIYTPLKRVTPLAVIVGAIPGALPNVIGTVAFEGELSMYALMLFCMQFLWQMPHFWAVAWLADEDYKRAGFNLLPSQSGLCDASVGKISALFCVGLMVLTVWAGWIGLTGWVATSVLFVLNAYWTYLCWQLGESCSREAARKQMFMSFFHLPITLIVLLLDKLF